MTATLMSPWRACLGATLMLAGVALVLAGLAVCELLVTAAGPMSGWDVAAGCCSLAGLAAGGWAVAAGVWHLLRGLGR